MLPLRSALRCSILFLSLISLSVAAPADLEDRETACIALGNCPGLNPDPPETTPPPAAPAFGCEHDADPDGAQGYCPAVAATGWCYCSDSSTYPIETGDNPCGYTTPPAAGPTVIPTTNCAGPTTTLPAPGPTTSGRTKCNPDECPKYCSIGNGGSQTKRSLLSKLAAEAGLEKRFYENSDADQFPYELLKQSYTTNICPDKGKNTYIWRALDAARNNYAAALQGLSGCTTIFVASGKGIFSSHIWEQDQANTPTRDLQPNNYEDTIKDLKDALSAHKDDLTGGEAFLIIPTDPDNNGQLVYDQDIVNALSQAINDASGVSPTQKTYDPLDFETSTELGTNRRGTFSFEFDPKYNSNGQTTRAYRIIGEGNVYSLKTGI
ncbi:hypothetical protein MMC21_007677 [Puttea exsequens]|nr:hypothetical protein [Puttea exsequens]